MSLIEGAEVTTEGIPLANMERKMAVAERISRCASGDHLVVRVTLADATTADFMLLLTSATGSKTNEETLANAEYSLGRHLKDMNVTKNSNNAQVDAALLTWSLTE